MTTADKVLATAKAQVGYHEGYSGGHWDNIEKYAAEVPGLAWANGQPWCAVFVSWVALTAGAADLYPRTASCDVAGAWFKKAGRWSEFPAVGAQVFYGTAANLDHTGVVVAYDAITITTVEGNTNTDGSREGDGVYLKVRPRAGTNIVGYGYPKFPEGIRSADPAYSKETSDMALLADLDAARKKHGASRLRAVRVLLSAVAAARGPIAKTRIAAALAAIKGMLG
jgi:hypothetical protein